MPSCLAGLLLFGAGSCDAPLTVPDIVGRSYHDARVLILKAGWSPRQGVNDGVLSGNGQVFWDRGYTELVASSGAGLAPCRFEFTDRSGRVLVVGTEGEEDGSARAKVVHALVE